MTDSDGEAIYHVQDESDVRPTVAEIDLAALRRNAAGLAALAGDGAGMIAVIKADAYGHGALASARALAPDVAAFAVSLLEEGLELRAGGVMQPVLLLGACYGDAHEEVVARGLTPLVGEEADLERFAHAARGARLAIHVEIDTGMSRLGVRLERLSAFLARLQALPALELTGVCTHLSEADGDDAEVTHAQLAAFTAAQRQIEAAGLRPTWIHAANSAGLIRFPEARLTLSRPGLALYGYASVAAAAATLAPVMTLRSRIVALAETQGRRLATVPVGFADGYPRRAAGAAAALIGGRRAPLVGEVELGACTFAVAADAAVGDDVVLFGTQGGARLGADELGRWSGTIPWEITCAVTARVPRRYLGDAA